jgi:hypothetical protein
MGGVSGGGIKSSARSYSKYKVLCFGMGNREGTWRGSRVEFIDSK